MDVVEVIPNNENFNHTVDKSALFYNVYTEQREFDTVVLMFDGSCGPINPNGNMGYGFSLTDYSTGELIFDGWGYTLSGEDIKTSNNQAEWIALGLGLKTLKVLDIDFRRINVLGDSNIVISQASGYWKIKEGRLYTASARQVYDNFIKEIKKGDCGFSHVYREYNSHCDYLSNKYIEFLKEKGIDTGGEFRKPERVNTIKGKGGKNREMILTKNTKMQFGKYKDFYVREVLNFDPQYIDWLSTLDNITLKFKKSKIK